MPAQNVEDPSGEGAVEATVFEGAGEGGVTDPDVVVLHIEPLDQYLDRVGTWRQRRHRFVDDVPGFSHLSHNSEVGRFE